METLKNLFTLAVGLVLLALSVFFTVVLGQNYQPGAHVYVVAQTLAVQAVMCCGGLTGLVMAAMGVGRILNLD